MSHERMKLKYLRAWELFFFIWRINTRSLESIMKLMGVVSHKRGMFTFCQANIYLMKMTFFNLNKVTTFLPTVMCTSSISFGWTSVHIYTIMSSSLYLRPFEISHMFSFWSWLLITVEFYHEILIAETTGFLTSHRRRLEKRQKILSDKGKMKLILLIRATFQWQSHFIPIHVHPVRMFLDFSGFLSRFYVRN